jgi:hypothetical protein|tara:strand:- start:96 stop:485 length:390 start_codon:yes stop_codon:yes gene_type:complete
MTRSGSLNIQVFCEINTSEESSKVNTAVRNIFPNLEISINHHQIIGKSSSVESLSNISESINTKNTKNILQRILKQNTDGHSTWFYLNKQAAFVNMVVLCNESDESPLGPIKVVIEANNVENIIQSLTS